MHVKVGEKKNTGAKRPIFQFSSWNKIFELSRKGHKPRQAELKIIQLSSNSSLVLSQNRAKLCPRSYWITQGTIQRIWLLLISVSSVMEFQSQNHSGKDVTVGKLLVLPLRCWGRICPCLVEIGLRYLKI